jgi:hypothetical protein
MGERSRPVIVREIRSTAEETPDSGGGKRPVLTGNRIIGQNLCRGEIPRWPGGLNRAQTKSRLAVKHSAEECKVN